MALSLGARSSPRPRHVALPEISNVISGRQRLEALGGHAARPLVDFETPRRGPPAAPGGTESKITSSPRGCGSTTISGLATKFLPRGFRQLRPSPGRLRPVERHERAMYSSHIGFYWMWSETDKHSKEENRWQPKSEYRPRSVRSARSWLLRRSSAPARAKVLFNSLGGATSGSLFNVLRTLPGRYLRHRRFEL